MSFSQAIDKFKLSQAHYGEYQSLPSHLKEIIFYAEGSRDWIYWEKIFHKLNSTSGIGVCYLTSDFNDPLLKKKSENFRVFYIGEGVHRTHFFRTVKTKLFLMNSLIDLGNSFLKRSIHPVHYLYINNALMSTHMVSREGAFNHFDTVFTVGPHQVSELREAENIYSLKAKNLFEHGYGRLDQLIEEVDSQKAELSKSGRPKILIAPSWGTSSITKQCAFDLVRNLLSADMEVVLRPHPMSFKTEKNELEKIKKVYSSHPLFTFEQDLSHKTSILSSHVMVSDWSGAALDFAFALKRPVLSIDTPPKVMNKNYLDLKATPLEVFIRKDIGAVLAPQKLQESPHLIKNLIQNMPSFEREMPQLRDKWVFNVGKSDELGAQEILRIFGKI